ncbi:hypothetical protein E2562_012611 [Oryza meyeriana var. granulata]|uniref:Uncharacterized protein n=1 Tax=Oryza meyeriana var. granulata TaxID=110450 RepID=A0A6G1CGL3_9ORYZ|nr:hypothetical protein E2562_012611 [Oryza meyeriana var. granulata]
MARRPGGGRTGGAAEGAAGRRTGGGGRQRRGARWAGRTRRTGTRQGMAPASMETAARPCYDCG